VLSVVVKTLGVVIELETMRFGKELAMLARIEGTEVTVTFAVVNDALAMGVPAPMSPVPETDGTKFELKSINGPCVVRF
jgi:hypothetical protein